MKTHRDSINIALYVYGDALDPAKITSATGVEPTNQHKIGHTHLTSTGRKVTQKTGMWRLLSSENADSFYGHFDGLADRLTTIARSKVLQRKDLGIDEAFVDVFVCAAASKKNDYSAKFELLPAQLSILNDLGVPIKFSASAIEE